MGITKSDVGRPAAIYKVESQSELGPHEGRPTMVWTGWPTWTIRLHAGWPSYTHTLHIGPPKLARTRAHPACLVSFCIMRMTYALTQCPAHI